MLGLDRRAAQAAWTVFLVVLALAAIYAIRRTLVIFILALLLAYLLSPVVDLVSRFTPRRVSRTVSLAIVYVVLLAVLVLAGIAIGSRVAVEAASLAGKLPEALRQDPLSRLPFPTWLEPMRARITELIRSQLQNLDQDVVPLLHQAGGQILSGLGNLLTMVVVPILSFFFIKDGRAIRAAVIDMVADERHRSLVDEIFSDLHVLLAQYIRALVLLSLATMAAYTLFLTIMGMPYPLLLAGVSALLEFIPVVGPLAGSVVILLAGALNGYPYLLWILIFLVAYRLFQDYVLNPYLMSSGVEIHPALVLFGVLAGEQIGGIPGMFLSVPVIATLRVIYVRLRRKRRAV